jgi:hypothetical protein
VGCLYYYKSTSAVPVCYSYNNLMHPKELSNNNAVQKEGWRGNAIRNSCPVKEGDQRHGYPTPPFSRLVAFPTSPYPISCLIPPPLPPSIAITLPSKRRGTSSPTWPISHVVTYETVQKISHSFRCVVSYGAKQEWSQELGN